MSTTGKGSGAGKRYSIGLAGVSNYQDAICVCRHGEPVRVFREVGNPYDADALVVVSQRDETIGYIPKANWLRDAIHEEGKGCDAWIKSIHGEREPMGVVVEVTLNDSELDSRDYKSASRSSATSNRTGCLVALCAVPLTLMLKSLAGV